MTAAEDSPAEGPGESTNRLIRTALLLWALLLANPGWMLSVAFHSQLVGCLAFFVVRAERDAQRLGLEAAFSNRLGEESFENVLGGSAVQIVESAGGSTGAQADLLAQQAANSAAAQAMRDHLAGMGTGSGGGPGDGQGSGRGPGLSGAFFGTQTEGRTFVYVIDMSGSMAGRRFDRAKSEIVRSITKLKPEQSFYVYFFNDRTIPLFEPHPAKGMLPATAANKMRARRWIMMRSPSSTTNPTFAMQMALEMKPDVIFLLTDGELDSPDLVRNLIRENNKSNTQVHTIAFENEDGARTLEAIANENNGTFRFEK